MRNRVGDPATQCIRKRQYQSHASARLALAKLHRAANRHHARPDKALGPYKCPHCGLWHLGNRRKKA